MKSFSTKDGDVVVGKTIEIVDGNELIRQKIERVLGTNLGEWSYDPEEGIDFRVILKKNYDEAEIRATIEQALTRLEEPTFTISEFSIETNGRTAKIKFKAANNAGEEVGGEYYYD